MSLPRRDRELGVQLGKVNDLHTFVFRINKNIPQSIDRTGGCFRGGEGFSRGGE